MILGRSQATHCYHPVLPALACRYKQKSFLVHTRAQDPSTSPAGATFDMSGFEALGLACGVFQTVSFALDAAQICRDIYNGQKSPDSHLEDVAKAMREAADRTKGLGIAVDATPEERRLTDIAEKCIHDARRLEKEVQNIRRLDSKGGFVGPLRARLSSFRRKKAIADLERSLGGYKDSMQHLMTTEI